MTAIISTLGGSDVPQIFMHNLAALAKTLPVEMRAPYFRAYGQEALEMARFYYLV
ncbi:MAG: hypothetical protein KIT39_10345 [Nitrospirales bacterium]|nr:hypothetical protein [Nitrospirales bacterium]